jgi:hypothetical protein
MLFVHTLVADVGGRLGCVMGQWCGAATKHIGKQDVKGCFTLFFSLFFYFVTLGISFCSLGHTDLY